MTRRWMLLFFAYLLFTTVHHTVADEQEQARQALAGVIEGLFDGVEVSRITESAVPGLYEVLVGAEVIYVSADGRYMLRGDLIDLRERVNLSEDQRSLARRAIIANIAADDMVTFAAEDAQHDVYVFTDISCGYCRRLHQDMAELNQLGITVHYLAFPRAGSGSQTWRDMEAVWCSEDKNAAMTMAKAGDKVTAKPCANPVQMQHDLGLILGVRGTPAIYLEDGTSLPGYVPPQLLLQELRQADVKEPLNKSIQDVPEAAN